ncbi:hypothetical protein AN189_07445 [Loktanella sp. 3ANDIMAR09]|uniref:hypothetical protein n=1 Tax=Loktanella sp. 3ANDIMAR09 TaxID=1225657 RepID=UPI0006F9E988|nr:hypothetical protein [Loktanella sp. 3ANDIMAR09]KQI68724.1 hypothetical protein AN189_07445 [Loktanella sp. 3ANDIMAR09]
MGRALNDTVVIRLARSEAESIRLGLADILCWISGFRAAREGTDLAGHEPLGVDRARDISRKLLGALEPLDLAQIELQSLIAATHTRLKAAGDHQTAHLLLTVAREAGYDL